jgi:hypothetical protein
VSSAMNASAPDGVENLPRRGRLKGLGLGAVVVVVYFALALLNPWALHIGGRWTPLLTWTGSGFGGAGELTCGILERAMGIEPTSEAWEASILPLNYARSGHC